MQIRPGEARVPRAETLLYAGGLLADQTHPDAIVRAVVAPARELARAARAYVGLAEDDSVALHGGADSSPSSASGVWFGLGEGVPGRVCATGASYDSRDDHSHLLERLVADGLAQRDAVCVPVTGRDGRAVGCLLACDSDDGFDDDCSVWLALLAGMVASALERTVRARELLEHREEIARHMKSLREMASQLTVAEERERARIAADLHDRVGQLLALSALSIDMTLATEESPEQRAMLETVKARLRDAIAETRTLEFDLSPPVLRKFGLAAALEWLVESHDADPGARCDFFWDGCAVPASDDVQTALYRGGRELLLNAIKHSGASAIMLALCDEGDQLVVEVTDDGCGLPPDGFRESFGLALLRDRFSALGGELSLAGLRSGGTVARVALPTVRR